MKQTASKSQKKIDSLLTNVLSHHAAIRPVQNHELPRTNDESAFAYGQDFSQLPLNSHESESLNKSLTQSCPFNPQRCPFGGACHICPARVQSAQAIGIQRKATNNDKPSEIPPIVFEVLRSPGQPLDKETRAFFEPRFGHDFSRVRVHTDTKAAESAEAVNAMAYTVGCNIIFGSNQYRTLSGFGQQLIAHELTHVLQQDANNNTTPNNPLIGTTDNALEREADTVASRSMDLKFLIHQDPVTHISGLVQRMAIYRGNILDEGSCEHLACNSKYACEDNEKGISCPEGTRNYSKTKKYRPLFTCDTKCENGLSCSDEDNWMAIPFSRFAKRKCNQDLIVCANNKFTHSYVRDRSEREAWEVSRGIQDCLDVSPYASFTGSIYGDENDPDFKKDVRCHKKETKEKKEKS